MAPPDSSIDYYAELGISANAGEDEINKAYKKLGKSARAVYQEHVWLTHSSTQVSPGSQPWQRRRGCAQVSTRLRSPRYPARPRSPAQVRSSPKAGRAHRFRLCEQHPTFRARQCQPIPGDLAVRSAAAPSWLHAPSEDKRRSEAGSGSKCRPKWRQPVHFERLATAAAPSRTEHERKAVSRKCLQCLAEDEQCSTSKSSTTSV